MKTAIEEFIHELEPLILIGDLDSLRWNFRTMANKALEKEKEQIIEAYRFPNTLVDMSSEQYYNQTYNQ
jgi:hypothetical protein